MDYDWAIFLNDEFHQTFQKELSKQLLEKGSAGTGIKNFENYDFQLIVGIRDPEIKQIGNKVFAKIDFITPGSFQIPIEIYWTSKELKNILEVHKSDISELNLEINWYEKIPLEIILPYMNEIEEPE